MPAPNLPTTRAADVRRDTFVGHILGVGTSTGVRIVVGIWAQSPLGSFADCMVARADGHRVLLAPTWEVASYVSATYSFDETLVVPVEATIGADDVRVHAGELSLLARLGRRTAVGALLRLVPERLSTAPVFTRLTDPVARVVMPGVRTIGSAGQGRREFYGATDVRSIRSITASWDGRDLGALAPVAPSPDFGFSSTPRTPALTTITTTVEVPGQPG